MATNHDHERKKKTAVFGVSCVLLVAMVGAVAVGLSGATDPPHGGAGNDEVANHQRNVEMLCNSAKYPETCKHSLERTAENGTTDIKGLVKASFHVAAKEFHKLINNNTLFDELAKDPKTKEVRNVQYD